jgi:hypothetical protein
MAVKFSPWGNSQFVDATGAPASGYKIYTYAAGSSTLQTSYTSSDGLTAQSNPIVLNSLGLPTVGQIWLTVGQNYKLVWTDSNDVVKKTEDNISGVNDSSVTIDQWVSSGLTPTYVSASQFTLAGDQTSAFTVGRRVKFTVTAGTVYGRISVSAYAALTTITVVMDGATVLDAGLSAVSYGLLTPTNNSFPALIQAGSNITVTYDASGRPVVTGTTQTTIIRSYLAGLTLSTAGASATMSIAAGQCVDSTNTASMSLTATSKTTSAWALGAAAGGLDTGAIANSTWYHFYVIQRVDTSVVDCVFSTSASAPTLPTNYTLYRRIGSGKTNGSAQWTKFIQDGDCFKWDASVLDVNTTNPGITAISATLTVPLGINVQAIMNAQGVGVSNCFTLHISDLATADETPSRTAAPLGAITIANIAPAITASRIIERTNTSAQVRYRIEASGASDIVRIATLGWFDTRGRNE